MWAQQSRDGQHKSCCPSSKTTKTTGELEKTQFKSYIAYGVRWEHREPGVLQYIKKTSPLSGISNSQTFV